jgi:hypothetical protein
MIVPSQTTCREATYKERRKNKKGVTQFESSPGPSKGDLNFKISASPFHSPPPPPIKFSFLL